MEDPRSFPTSRGEEWAQTAYDRYCAGFSGCLNDGGPRTVTATKRCRQTSGCNQCEEISGAAEDSVVCLTNNLEDTGCCSNYEAAECVTNGGSWDEPTCTCISPIVVDVAGNGFNLTNAAGGVLFDILNNGVPEQIAWTSANSDDAWLALDRNANGRMKFFLTPNINTHKVSIPQQQLNGCLAYNRPNNLSVNFKMLL